MLTARYLAQAGVSVTIYEKGEMGRESSWAGGGIISPLYPWRYTDAVTGLARWGQQHYEVLSEELLAETGIDPEYTRSGLLMLDVSQRERAEAHCWAECFKYQVLTVDENEVVRLAPKLGYLRGRSLWMPGVAQVRNPRLVKALKASVVKNGVRIVENDPVMAIESEGGKTTGVLTRDGAVTAERVVICGGAWSGGLAKQLGVDLPVSPVRGQMLLFKASPGLLSQIVMLEGYYLIPRRDGRILAGSTLEHVGFDKQTTVTAREELYQLAIRILPALADAEIEMQWAGLRPGTVDGVPFIGPVPGHEGLFVNAGQYRNGVVTGLASARLLADMLTGEPPIIRSEPYLPKAG